MPPDMRQTFAADWLALFAAAVHVVALRAFVVDDVMIAQTAIEFQLFFGACLTTQEEMGRTCNARKKRETAGLFIFKINLSLSGLSPLCQYVFSLSLTLAKPTSVADPYLHKVCATFCHCVEIKLKKVKFFVNNCSRRCSNVTMSPNIP